MLVFLEIKTLTKYGILEYLVVIEIKFKLLIKLLIMI